MKRLGRRRWIILVAFLLAASFADLQNAIAEFRAHPERFPPPTPPLPHGRDKTP